MVFAKGAPIVAHFSGGYAEREELFMNRVLPARASGDHDFRMNHFFHEGSRRLTDHADLPGMQYLRVRSSIGKPVFRSHEATAHDRMKDVPAWPAVAQAADGPIDWDRQILFVKDGDPAGQNAIFIRDAVTGGQPTMWQMWFVSDGISDGRQEPKAIPKATTAGARPLEGDRFMVRGQFGIDTDLFVASPRGQPRHTLRWGTDYNYWPLHGVRESMDLLHLQTATDGDYFVAMVPRGRNEPRVTMTSLADDHVIKISTQAGIEYGFLAADATDAEAESVRFKGTAGAVSYRGKSTTASLGHRGGIQFAHAGSHGPETWEFAANGAASVRLEGDTLGVCIAPTGGRPVAVRLAGPAEWVADEPIEGIRIEDRADGLRVTAEGPAISAWFRRVP
jgi:hypothetical protein